MLKIDFGSGYNPKKGYKTCDMTLSPYLDFISKDNKIYDKKGEIQKNSVDVIHCRNTLHHVKDLESLIKNFYTYLKPNGRLEVIDCRKEYFKGNVFLDKVWYRYINKNENIYISETYNDYKKMCESVGFKKVIERYKEEKEITIFLKRR